VSLLQTPTFLHEGEAKAQDNCEFLLPSARGKGHVPRKSVNREGGQLAESLSASGERGPFLPLRKLFRRGN